MSDKRDVVPPFGITRRSALRWLVGAPFHVGLLSTAAAAQLQAPRNVRVLVPAVRPDSPIARGEYPRLLLNASMLAALRSRIKSDAAFRARWQTAVSQFESSGSIWNAKPNDQFAAAFAAFLTMVRRPADDLGLKWSRSWQAYRDHIVSAAQKWSRAGRHEQAAIATALIYDCLYNDLPASERAEFSAWVELGYNRNGWLASGVEVYDNGASDDHAAKLLCALVSTNASDLFPAAYAETIAIAETNDWMGFGFGLGREWHEGYTSRHGLPLQLYALKHAGGCTDAETVGYLLTHLRDAWWLTSYSTIPHPSVGARNGARWVADVFHTQDPAKGFHRGLNVAAHMAWAATILPGKVDLSGVGLSDRPTLARDEGAFLGALWYFLTLGHPVNGAELRAVFDVTRLGRDSSTDTARFWAFPAWLIHGLQERHAQTPVDAGLPLVRRYWPGTLEWTFVHSPDFAHDRGSVIRYTHRRYAASNYERGTNQNGRWVVHRDGPLLVQRGETGHSVTTRFFTWCANGAITFVDESLYPLFTWNAGDDGDRGDTRDFTAGNTKSQILANPSADFGPVTTWQADERVVAITSDLTRSYNSSEVQYGPLAVNEPKIRSFVRELVVIRRDGDGTDREKVFTYDRIQLLDTKFEPRYNLNPAANPDIDGVERPVQPWGPDQNDSRFDWYAAGPTHWDYSGATRLVYDNRDEPKLAPPGNGRVCVTWLEPSGANAKIRKSGGMNAVSKTNRRHNGYPFFSSWRGWQGKDEWAGFNNPEERAYVGLYTVAVSPAAVSLDTRFLIACEVMASGETPGRAERLPSDPASVAARCGASVVVFSKEGAGRSAGSVQIPSDVTLVVLVNLPPGATTTLAASGGLRITTANRTASSRTSSPGLTNQHGHLAVGVSGSGTLSFG